MTDVTDAFHRYRLASRSLWNGYMWMSGNTSWDHYEQFKRIKRVLFETFVLAPLGLTWSLEKLFRDPISLFEVIPSSPDIPLMVRRPSADRNLYWDDPLNRLARGEATLTFVDHFDWDSSGIIDFQYYRIRIVDFPSNSHLVGREALVDVHHAGVFYRPT